MLIDVNCKNSSTGKLVYDLYTEINKEGHTAAICYGRGLLLKEKNIYKFGINIETYFHALMTRITGITGAFSPLSTFRLINHLEKFKPDIVHLHELHGYFVNYTTLIKYLEKKNIKTIWTFHCDFMFTGKCGVSYDCNKWKKECDKCPQLKEYPATLFFDFTRIMFRKKKNILKDYNNLTIVTPSIWLKNRVGESFLKNKNIITIHNGINTDEIFYPKNCDHLRKKHGLTDEKIILSVAPNIMNDLKGGKWIIELAQRLKDENIKFIIIGVDDLTVSFDNNIIALKRTNDQNELSEYYTLADLTLITSKSETFSLVCAESLACGTPIIGFEAGAPSEIAPEGYGYFVEYGNIDALSEALQNIFHSKITMRDSSECITYAKNEYAKDIMFQEYLKLYSN
jgi:glycosyltransferase involved in cell wall biosynthesis